MNARILSVCLSLAGLMTLTSAQAIAGGLGWIGDTMGVGILAGAPYGGTVGERLRQNPRLADKVARLLPAGTDLQSAASGFWNLGQFVAAAHVSNNLGLSFADLKANIMAGNSLGDAIHALRPGADAQVEARRARASAADDIRSS
ncbi:MAG: hypothetical protein ACREVG_18700 [Burkholderiales bacterium]